MKKTLVLVFICLVSSFLVTTVRCNLDELDPYEETRFRTRLEAEQELARFAAMANHDVELNYDLAQEAVSNMDTVPPETSPPTPEPTKTPEPTPAPTPEPSPVPKTEKPKATITPTTKPKSTMVTRNVVERPHVVRPKPIAQQSNMIKIVERSSKKSTKSHHTTKKDKKKDKKDDEDDKYYIVKQDQRVCKPAQSCGGYYLYKLNDKAIEKMYVSKLEFQDPKLAANDSVVRNSFDYDIIVRGNFKLDFKDNTGKYNKFIVAGAYKKLQVPVVELSKSHVQQSASWMFNSRFYFLKHNDIQCLEAQHCSNISAELINSKKDQTIAINDFEEPYSRSVTLFDMQWFTYKSFTVQKQMIHLITDCEGKSPSIASSFASIPDPDPECDQIKSTECKSDHSSVYERMPNRCLNFAGCEENKFCSLAIPVCEDGYTLSSYSAVGGGGCPSYLCIADFLGSPITTTKQQKTKRHPIITK
ncbi:hypothetical protein DLAC_00093 [Tieghemostelium lacteum]|uniref:DUF6748 domain-containing protein n=1 Tax=Tieghemostelium lacteum TaxID=361077 RepID=A0A152A8U4_TIELA|nr:hypothetical protein DLAC_00093 [Tieghemostelium lacteum]|eukprot:KYR02643.1 hypothetical protein DLAC_00093 [Tieghemostelium lacteum]